MANKLSSLTLKKKIDENLRRLPVTEGKFDLTNTKT